jgi:hypothetical protein
LKIIPTLLIKKTQIAKKKVHNFKDLKIINNFPNQTDLIFLNLYKKNGESKKALEIMLSEHLKQF